VPAKASSLCPHFIEINCIEIIKLFLSSPDATLYVCLARDRWWTHKVCFALKDLFLAAHLKSKYKTGEYNERDFGNEINEGY
jgi:hypothetical protein